MKVEAQIPFSNACKTTQWDPEAILGFTNLDRGSFTCVGYARSMHRRCRNPIGQNERDLVYGMLDLLDLRSTNSGKVATQLKKVACRSLCWRHGDQANDVVEKWEASIAAYKARENTKQSKLRTKKSQPASSSSYTRKTDEHVEACGECFRLKVREGLEQGRKRAQQDQERKKMEEEQEKEKRQQEQRDKEARERRQQEAQNRRKREQQEREQREREQKEQREREQREQREQRKREQKEQREREQKEQQEREKQEREQQEREQQERERAVKERREWQQAWQNYVTKWAAKHEASTIQQSQALVPWSMKSGGFGDLTAEHVMSFYHKAYTDTKPTSIFYNMERESLQWHPDTMVTLYRNCAPSDAVVITSHTGEYLYGTRAQSTWYRKRFTYTIDVSLLSILLSLLWLLPSFGAYKLVVKVVCRVVLGLRAEVRAMREGWLGKLLVFVSLLEMVMLWSLLNSSSRCVIARLG